jgi:hypothetical protein
MTLARVERDGAPSQTAVGDEVAIAVGGVGLGAANAGVAIPIARALPIIIAPSRNL